MVSISENMTLYLLLFINIMFRSKFLVLCGDVCKNTHDYYEISDEYLKNITQNESKIFGIYHNNSCLIKHEFSDIVLKVHSCFLRVDISSIYFIYLNNHLTDESESNGKLYNLIMYEVLKGQEIRNILCNRRIEYEGIVYIDLDSNEVAFVPNSLYTHEINIENSKKNIHYNKTARMNHLNYAKIGEWMYHKKKKIYALNVEYPFYFFRVINMNKNIILKIDNMNAKFEMKNIIILDPKCAKAVFDFLFEYFFEKASEKLPKKIDLKEKNTITYNNSAFNINTWGKKEDDLTEIQQTKKKYSKARRKKSANKKKKLDIEIEKNQDTETKEIQENQNTIRNGVTRANNFNGDSIYIDYKFNIMVNCNWHFQLKEKNEEYLAKYKDNENRRHIYTFLCSVSCKFLYINSQSHKINNIWDIANFESFEKKHSDFLKKIIFVNFNLKTNDSTREIIEIYEQKIQVSSESVEIRKYQSEKSGDYSDYFHFTFLKLNPPRKIDYINDSNNNNHKIMIILSNNNKKIVIVNGDLNYVIMVYIHYFIEMFFFDWIQKQEWFKESDDIRNFYLNFIFNLLLNSCDVNFGGSRVLPINFDNRDFYSFAAHLIGTFRNLFSLIFAQNGKKYNFNSITRIFGNFFFVSDVIKEYSLFMSGDENLDFIKLKKYIEGHTIKDEDIDYKQSGNLSILEEFIMSLMKKGT